MDTHEIKTLWDTADTTEQTANELRWQVAEQVAAKLTEGSTQVELAEKLSRSPQLLSYYNRVWTERGDGWTVSESFQDAYRFVQTNPKTTRRARQPRVDVREATNRPDQPHEDTSHLVTTRPKVTPPADDGLLDGLAAVMKLSDLRMEICARLKEYADVTSSMLEPEEGEERDKSVGMCNQHLSIVTRYLDAALAVVNGKAEVTDEALFDFLDSVEE